MLNCLLLVVIDTWDNLYQWFPANEIAFLQGSAKNSLLIQQVTVFVLLWNIFPLDQANTIFLFSVREPYFLSLSALLFDCDWCKRMYMKPVMEKAIAAKTHNCSFVHGTACLVCSDIMVPCDWLHYRAPPLPHYWQLLSTSSYCYYLIGLLFISAFDFSFLNAANCTGLLALMFWTLLEFYPT